MESSNPTQVRRVADDQLTIIDRVRVALQQKGQQTIYFNLADFATSIDMRAPAFYQALYRLNKTKELEILTETKGGDNRPRIIGVKLLKLEEPGRTIHRALSKSVDTNRLVRRTISKIQERIPNLLSYQEKKNVVDHIRTQLFEAGFNPAEVLQLPTENLLAEEGLIVYDELVDAQKRVAELETQLELLGRVAKPEQEAKPELEAVSA